MLVWYRSQLEISLYKSVCRLHNYVKIISCFHNLCLLEHVDAEQKRPTNPSNRIESPTQFSSLFSNMLWSTVSNAALRSNYTKTKTFPLSVFKWMSFKTLKRAASVLLCGSNPDWKTSKQLFRAVNLLKNSQLNDLT